MARRHRRHRNVKSKALKYARGIKRFIGRRHRKGAGLAEMRNIYNKLFEINEVINNISQRAMSGLSESEQSQISSMLDKLMADALIDHGQEMAEVMPVEHAEIVDEIEPENVEPEVYEEISGDVDDVGDDIGDDEEFEDEEFEGEALGGRRGRRRKSSGTDAAFLRRKHPNASARQIANWVRFARERKKGGIIGSGRSKEKANKLLKRIEDMVNSAENYDFKTKPNVRRARIESMVDKALNSIVSKKQLKALLEKRQRPKSDTDKLLKILSEKLNKRGEATQYATVLKALSKGKDRTYLDSLLNPPKGATRDSLMKDVMDTLKRKEDSRRTRYDNLFGDIAAAVPESR